MSDLVQRLNEPEEYYPGNFDTVKRANAMLSCLCQEAANALEAKDKEISFLKNELADALDCKNGIGPTALSTALSHRDKYKTLCDKMGKEMDAAIPLLEVHTDWYFEALAAWKEMK